MKKEASSSTKPKPPLGGPVGRIGKPSSSKKPKLPLEGSVGGKGKQPSVKRKKMGSEIDEIFAAKKRTKPEEDDDKPSRKSSVAEKLSKRTVVKGSKARVVRRDFFQDSGPSQRKKTADGLTVYTEEELGFGKSEAGGTRLCPFDCDCCF